jgi:hypothetical protein
MKRQLLDWCILLSTIANISSAGILLYIAQHRFDVRVLDSSIYVYASDGQPLPIKIMDVDRDAPPIKVQSTAR